MSNIFVTGATGFLGSSLINEILVSSRDTVYALVRGNSSNGAKGRLFSILRGLSEREGVDKEIENRVQVCLGDITERNLGLKKNIANSLKDTIDIIYHCAAITDLNWPLEKIRYVNVDGTKNVLDFASIYREKGRFKKLNHISTAYVAGTKRGVFKETDLDVGQRFNNTYEYSKYEAEKVVYKYRKTGIDIDIFRPSIILGRYSDGKTIKFKMFYQPLHFFSRGLFKKVAVVKNSRTNCINVDIAARAIVLIARLSKKKNMNYHIVSPENQTLPNILDIASHYIGFKKPEFVLSEELDIYEQYTPVQRRMIEPYTPYFNCLTEFAVRNTIAQLRKSEFRFPKFDDDNLKRLLKYSSSIGFIKNKKKCC